MPSELRSSTLIHICKNEGDIQNCTVIVELNLWSHTMKHWERMIEHRLRHKTIIFKNQFDFFLEWSTMESILCLDA